MANFNREYNAMSSLFSVCCFGEVKRLRNALFVKINVIKCGETAASNKLIRVHLKKIKITL